MLGNNIPLPGVLGVFKLGQCGERINNWRAIAVNRVTVNNLERLI